MAATAISIDAAASGLLRHRFVRAFAASVCVLFAGVVLWAIAVPFSGADKTFRENGIVGVVSLVVFAPIMMLFLFSAAIAIAAALFGFIHRRITAFLLLVLYGAMFVFGAIAIALILPQMLGLLPKQPTSHSTPLQDATMMTILIIATFILFEAAGWAWWQLRVDRAQYFAARGWRAPPQKIYSVARQSLGMPSFISNFGRGRVLLTVIYFLIAVLNLGLLAVLAAPFSLFAASDANGGGGANLANGALAAAGFLGLLLLNAIGLGAWLNRIAAAQATRLYQKARDWDARPPVVFLRAFDQDAQKLKPRSIDPLVKFPAGCGEAKTLDELLLEHASAYGPVIAIGDPRDPTPPLGAARIFVPDEGNEWRHVVTSLLGASSAVVMCPSTSEGVKWELDLIADAIGRLRVIFLANPLLTVEQTHMLFRRLAPGGDYPELKRRHVPIAAFLDAQLRWTVLTTKQAPCVQTYTVALNYALQSLLGLKGAALPKQRNAALRSPRTAAAV